jgi:hypothetical protein
MMQLGVTQARSGSGMSDGDFRRLQVAVTAAYAPERLRASTRKHLSMALSNDEAANVVRWLSTELGARVTNLEEQANADPEKAQERLRNSRGFVDVLPAARKTRIERLEHDVEAVQTNVNVVIDTNIGIARGVALTMKADGPSIDVDAVAAQIESQRAMLEGTLRPQVLAGLALTYQQLSDADLDAYLAFLESPIGRKYAAAGGMALEKALGDAALELGRQMAPQKSAQLPRVHLVA